MVRKFVTGGVQKTVTQDEAAEKKPMLLACSGCGEDFPLAALSASRCHECRKSDEV